MKIDFHIFTMGDVEDPDIFAAEPIYQWQQTEQGRWVMDHADDLAYYRSSDPVTWGYRFVIRGEINDAVRLTEYLLRWPKQNQS